MTDEQRAVERIEVARLIEAEPAAIFPILCDPQGHVAIDSSGMLHGRDGRTGERGRRQFVVHMDREALNDFPLGKYDVTVSITHVRAGPRDRMEDHRPDPAADRPRLRVHGSSRPTTARSSRRTTTGRRSTRCGGSATSSRSSPRARCVRRSASSPAPSTPGTPPAAERCVVAAGPPSAELARCSSASSTNINSPSRGARTTSSVSCAMRSIRSSSPIGSGSTTPGRSSTTSSTSTRTRRHRRCSSPRPRRGPSASGSATASAR